MDDIREQLFGRDYLYNDASSYRAGVEAALQALADRSQVDLRDDVVELDRSRATASGQR